MKSYIIALLKWMMLYLPRYEIAANKRFWPQGIWKGAYMISHWLKSLARWIIRPQFIVIGPGFTFQLWGIGKPIPNRLCAILARSRQPCQACATDRGGLLERGIGNH